MHHAWRRYAASVDTWAYGCILVCLEAEACNPYPSESADGSCDIDVRDVIENRLRPSLEPSHALSELVAHCCEHEPAKRWSMARVATWLEGVDAGAFRDEPASLVESA